MKVDNAPDEWVKLARAVFARNTEVPPDKLPLAGWFIAREEMAMRAALAAVAPLIAAQERERCAVIAENHEWFVGGIGTKAPGSGQAKAIAAAIRALT